GVLLAQREAGRQDGDVLALDELLDPPVGIVGVAQLQRLAGTGQVVEVPARHRLPDLEVDPGVLLRHPRAGRGPALRAGPRRRLGSLAPLAGHASTVTEGISLAPGGGICHSAPAATSAAAAQIAHTV